MSTLKVAEIRNASSATGGLSIAADGVVSGALPYPNRNLLYNGAMQVAQRGTSTTGITASSYNTADRWRTGLNSFGTWTQTVENDAPTGSGLRKSLKMLCTTADAAPAAGDVGWIDQLLEGQDVQRVAKGTSDAKQLTVSFWVKSNVTGTYIAELFDFDNTRQVSASYTVSASATWEKKTITFPADTTGVLDNDNANSFGVRFFLGAGTNYTSGTLNTSWASSTNTNRAVGQTNLAAATNNYWQVTGVQLEVGDTATEFEFKSYGQELRECQRYFIRWASGSNQTIGTSFYFTGTSLYSVISFPTAMRVGPALSVANGTNWFANSVNGGDDLFNTFDQIVRATPLSCLIGITTNVAGTAGQAGNIFTNNASAFVDFSSEL